MPEQVAGASTGPSPIEQRLMAAGAGWRASQPEPLPLDPSIFAADGPRLGSGLGTRPWSFAAGIVAGIAATLVIVLFGMAVAPGWFPRTGVEGPGPSAVAGPSRGEDLAHCPVTKPSVPFEPDPSAAIPADKAWYGNRLFWTWLDRDGEVWDGLTKSELGFSQKTFWWSALFDVHREEQPEIYVIGSRIGAPGRFGFGPGTNASGDFGSAMLVGVDVPEEGCWNVTAHYRGADLSYVVWVGPRT
jgi:hypothetical protein